jgi:phosphohistidine swiveling domain-containing protein
MPDVTFDLPDPALAEYTWIISDEHTPVAAAPLTGQLFARPGNDAIPRSVRVNGFSYTRHGAGLGPGETPFSNAPVPDSIARMRSWRVEWQPEVDKVVAALEDFDPTLVQPGKWRDTLDFHAAEYWRVFGPVHRDAVGPAHAVGRHFRELYAQRFGEDRAADAVALLQGMPNASLERAALLWDASRVLRAHPELMTAVAKGEVPAGDEPAAHEFRDRLTDVQQRFGATGEGFVEDQPTWAEDPAIPLAAIRAYAGQPDGQGPLDWAARQRARREALEAELRALAPTDDEAAELLRLLPIAQELMPNLEDHNYYTDQRLSAASRQRWLAVGRLLLARGLVDDESDVFYFERDELVATLEGKAAVSKETLAARRAQVALWRSVAPPPVLGKPLEPAELPAGVIAHASEVRVVRGAGVSPGSYRGRARVIDAIAEAATLQPGDILVTRATTPAWTPFFGVASALVINVGGMLSHAAVVAREFGLPAVVGTINGTALIPDGATITVDGSSGIVLVEA